LYGLPDDRLGRFALLAQKARDGFRHRFAGVEHAALEVAAGVAGAAG